MMTLIRHDTGIGKGFGGKMVLWRYGMHVALGSFLL
jgi:hypothetical protein